MSHNEQFLPLEIQTSIAELRTLGTPDHALSLLIDRILKASEAKTTSLQMDIVRIEDSITLRLDRLGEKLASDLQVQHGATNAMLIDLRAAQMIAHPLITDLRKAFEDMNIWSGRIEAAFIEGRDFAAHERAALRADIAVIDQRLVAAETAIGELKADAEP